jgi:hypothetical protein
VSTLASSLSAEDTKRRVERFYSSGVVELAALTHQRVERLG